MFINILGAEPDAEDEALRVTEEAEQAAIERGLMYVSMHCLYDISSHLISHLISHISYQ